MGDASRGVWSNNPICMKAKDNGGRRPGGPDRDVTPRYAQRNHPNVSMAPSKLT
jgi:hypothetical protein